MCFEWNHLEAVVTSSRFSRERHRSLVVRGLVHALAVVVGKLVEADRNLHRAEVLIHIRNRSSLRQCRIRRNAAWAPECDLVTHIRWLPDVHDEQRNTLSKEAACR